MIYLDNAATSGKKPEEVYVAVDHALRHSSGNPGRSGHSISLAAGQIVEETRQQIAAFFHAGDASAICFTPNTTTALNTAIFGLVRPGDHVITSALEHNSVSRPLEYLRSLGCEITILPASPDTGVDPAEVEKSLKTATSLVVMTHCSNVTGTLNDICSVGEICRAHEVPFLVDAAQSAGTRAIDLQKMPIDLLAFPGHKGLLGPQGTGGLYIRKDLPVQPLTRGGTGSFSELLDQPEQRPDRYESGTLNVPGLAGLGAGVRYLSRLGMDTVERREAYLREMMIEGLQEIPGITIYGPRVGQPAGCVISFTLEGMEPSEISAILDTAFDIGVRAGLHCAPYAHRALGTLASGGTVRVSPHLFTEDEEIETFLDAMRQIAAAQ